MTMFLHFGVHKTATTYLRREFFPNLEGVQYFDARADFGPFVEHIVKTDDLEFCREKASELFFQISENKQPNLPGILSHETLYSPLFWNQYALRRRACDRLAEVFPDGRAVLVVRNQGELLRSLYSEYIKTGGVSGWNTFLSKHISPGYLHFYSYIRHLMATYGDENVAVFCYEDFVRNRTGYLKQWGELLGVSCRLDGPGGDRELHNQSLSARSIQVMRTLNVVLGPRRASEKKVLRRLRQSVRNTLIRFQSPGDRGSRGFPEAGNESLRFLLDGCREGNRRLSVLLDRDMKAMGYPC